MFKGQNIMMEVYQYMEVYYVQQVIAAIFDTQTKCQIQHFVTTWELKKKHLKNLQKPSGETRHIHDVRWYPDFCKNSIFFHSLQEVLTFQEP